MKFNSSLCHFRARQQCGFTLVEMMVGIIVSLIGTLAMVSAFAVFESQKRTTTSGSDAQQNGSFSLYELERQIRTAGSGMVQGKSWGLFGCTMSSSHIPLTGLSGPFAAMPTAVRAIPVVVQSGGASSDVIQILSGNPAVQVFRTVVQTATTNAVTLDPNYSNVTGLYANELMLGVSAAGTCTTGKIATLTTPGNITFTGTVGAGFTGSAYLFDFGAAPVMSLFGVDTTGTNPALVRYDMTLGSSSTVADGIMMMKVLYGVDDGANGGVIDDNIVDEWVKPEGTTWGYAALTDGSATAASSMSRIKSLRVAVIAQNLLPEKIAVTSNPTPTIVMFSDQASALQTTVNLSQFYHYRVYDTTIPLRNLYIQKFY